MRWLVALAAAVALAACAVVSAAEPSQLVRTNNSGGNAVVINEIAGTPCWRQGQFTYRPAGVPFSACATTSTSSTSTSSIPASTTSLAPTTTAPESTSTTTSSTSSPPATTGSPTTTVVSPPPTSTLPPSGVQFVETFDGNTGLDRFRYGVYHRHGGHHEVGQPEPFSGVDNNQFPYGTWSADHDLACGGADTQRPMLVTGDQDTDGSNGWRPLLDFNTSQMMYVCRDHVMSTMGDVAGFSVLWFAPNQQFADVTSVSFDVNLTDLGSRKWWKVGVVSDELWNSTYAAGQTQYTPGVIVPGFVVSDVGSADLNTDLDGPDRLFATWAGDASGGQNGGMKIGDRLPGSGTQSPPNDDKMTRLPVSFTDNGDGTVTFVVNGVSLTESGSFPTCPCHVVFLDQNYTPDKDGVPQGHTWHWDNIIVSG
jgi:hypothetical protein